MDIKRYEMMYDEAGVPYEEEAQSGDWCKYEDIEVVLQVLKSNILDLKRDLKETKESSIKQLEIVQSWVEEMEENSKMDVDYLNKAWDNIEGIKDVFKE